MGPKTRSKNGAFQTGPPQYCKRKFASSDLHLLPSLWRRRSLKSDEPRLSSASGRLAKPGSVETILKHDTRTHALESRAIRPKMSHGRHRGLTERQGPEFFLIAPRRSENSPAAANAKKQTLKRRQAIPPARSQSVFQAWRRHCNEPPARRPFCPFFGRGRVLG